MLNGPDRRGSLWHFNDMHSTVSRRMSRKLVDSLYVEAMVMADEARAYFDRHGDRDRESLDIMTRVSFSCESLKVTTRLMHVIAWLLTQRAAHNGELRWNDLTDPRHRLGEAEPPDAEAVARFPLAARSLIEASQDLYDRAVRLEVAMGLAEDRSPPVPQSPARELLHRLETSF